MSLFALLAIYVFGGLTFIPLVLSIAFLHAYITQPEWTRTSRTDNNNADDSPLASERDTKLSDSEFEGLPKELKTRAHVPDVAAGYFAVCREYVPGGINGKPPERTTPAGAVVAMESPSVYQSMYRSIFDRNKTTSPSIDGANTKSKKARNVFYVVLRLGHLMLYDDIEQLEVRHVISLAHYDVDIYAGGETIPEGELWIKRNCIRLTTRRQSDANPSESRKPFYLFSENCSEKEDFYHAMLQSQERRAESTQNPQPVPLKFNTPDLVRLVQQLHASEENLHTRWINALVGRLFLALYKTKDVERYLWTKITKKIARVPKPALISSINLVKVDTGTLPPFLTNPKLKELTVDGDLIVEADVSYKGNFRVEISAIARIDLGTRFKAREVTLVLATTLKKLDGHILLRMKPSPSNRLWMSFETAPKMELSVEPIVSSRQITYGVILRAIESRLREVVSETLVSPNWDDIPFSDTISNQLRGGIWSDSSKENTVTPHVDTLDQEISYGEKDWDAVESELLSPSLMSPDGPRLARKVTASSPNLGDSSTVGFSSAFERPVSMPKVMRSDSFANAASPVVDVSSTNASATKSELPLDAATTMKTTMSRSQPTSPAESPVGSFEQPSNIRSRARGSASSMEAQTEHHGEQEDAMSILSTNTLPIMSSESTESNPTSPKISHNRSRHGSSMSLPRNALGSTDKRQAFNQSINTATAAAKKWFASKQNQGEQASLKPSVSRESLRSVGDDVNDGTKDSLSSKDAPISSENSAPLGSPAHPIGRGQPLPPPGTPLPGPPKPATRNTGWGVPTAATFANLAKRKPIATKQPTQPTGEPSPPKDPSPPPPPLPARTPTTSHYANHNNHERASVGTAAMGIRRKSASNHTLTSAGARRQRRSVTDAAIKHGNGSGNGHGNGNGHGPTSSHDEGLLVVEAPVLEASAPSSPVATEHSKDVKSTQDSSSGKSRDRESVDEGVFPGMEVDERVT